MSNQNSIRKYSMFALLFVVNIFLVQPVFAQSAQQKLLIGLIPEMNIFKQKQRFTLLGEYLSEKTGIPVEFTILSRYGNIIDSFTSEKMDGAFFGSFTGAMAIQKLEVVPLARPVNLDGTSTYHGYLFVRKDSGIKSVNDMRGKRMAFVEKATTAGYIFPLAFLRENGITDSSNFFSESFFTGSHDAAIIAVLDRKADVGAAKHSIYDRVKKDNPRIEEEIAITARSPSVPSNGLCVRKTLDPEMQKKLKKALLDLESDHAGQEVLAKFGALRFIDTTTVDYQPVFDMVDKAGIDIKKYTYLNE
ncbi:MAG: phosphate/phosphite/phosphonate ABC transporter substrate-binding protein [Proteobacteria bacterium]|nr:phosphate/phosphite/phosphonate ABC transporter substrate-binding protein [Pseudomonadota bacterium]MBU1716335.1 phosphate/phosphite/phosphonate ABC transporter substrate-binding protein [Pseudomonadota bacterium]